jgi:hypothetical protein
VFEFISGWQNVASWLRKIPSKQTGKKEIPPKMAP